MTSNQTIDGVPRDSVLLLVEFLADARAYHKVVIERCNDCIKSGESSEREEYGRIGYRTEKIEQVERLAEELRALLDAPECKVCNDTKKMHEPGQEPGSCAACFDESVEQPQPDQVLCKFYDVTDYPGLVRELVGHVAQLQDSAKRNVKPWEDTFPPTLLPAYIERVNAENAAAQPQGEPSHWADPAGNTITAELKAYNLKLGGAPAAASAHYADALYRYPPEQPQGEQVELGYFEHRQSVAFECCPIDTHFIWTLPKDTRHLIPQHFKVFIADAQQWKGHAEQPAPVAVVQTCCGSCPAGCPIGVKA